MRLDGNHALVTGGGRGIGRAIAAALTQAGATVTVVGRSEAALREAVAMGEAAGCAVADVTIPAMAKLLEFVWRRQVAAGIQRSVGSPSHGVARRRRRPSR